ncbi:MAG: hypothetical protein A3D16_16795 [Rhodobacterales bacterium RIFCSPHIGHO2_02_FULL_62_130]|nr:MAG: hypothetical protein A3D16_16795 [Rhodobacterales bacterium RIFCSPHIGHO2_02_FULL_62_130]OHC60551.1 MAG: hypothetical protein A3E48_13425 [Rhodobacterales bacterium RIFCSPHIGHO2_12_FULL_62_75]
MIETLTALLFAHIVADFVLQTRWMVENKSRVAGLAVHGALVGVTAGLTLGGLSLAVLWLAGMHLLTDYAKTRAPKGLAAFAADQAAHLVTLLALALWQPDLWQAGLWAGRADWVLPVMAVTGGAILATRAGGFAIGMLMAPFVAASPDGLTGGGRVIGLLERGLIFAMILLGQPEGVGLLIAAKSILRFGAVKDDRAASEYVIIGTLASFGWAMIAAHATLALTSLLPPLGILPATP